MASIWMRFSIGFSSEQSRRTFWFLFAVVRLLMRNPSGFLFATVGIVSFRHLHEVSGSTHGPLAHVTDPRTPTDPAQNYPGRGDVTVSDIAAGAFVHALG